MKDHDFYENLSQFFSLINLLHIAFTLLNLLHEK